MPFLNTIFFDREDHQLLHLIEEIRSTKEDMHSLLERYLHPQGIKELSAEHGLRVACAAVSLLDAPINGAEEERLLALRSLYDEVMYAGTHLSHNTARVLIQIMKELLRNLDIDSNNAEQQIRLAHDFRMTAIGNSHLTRKQLQRYHLLEMPEEWNQLAFDHHVHDASTKGRKNPTHLVLDAWIKGIRQLTVVYYNYLEPAVVNELLQAGNILGVTVQAAVEFSVPFRNRYIHLCWEPAVFDDHTAFLKYIQNERVRSFFAEGRKVSQYQQRYIFEVLHKFNRQHRLELENRFYCSIAEVNEEDFLQYIGSGQPNLLHLASYIREKLPAGAVSIDTLITEYLQPAENPELRNFDDPAEAHDAPELLQVSLPVLIDRLLELHPFSRLTLNAATLSAQDVLELLYLGHGAITHLELYNLKNSHHNSHHSIEQSATNCSVQERDALHHSFPLICRLQQALTVDNAGSLKQAIRKIIEDYEGQVQCQQSKVLAGSDPALLLEMKERRLDLLKILSSIEKLYTYYHGKELHTAIGSSSTGRASDLYFGMGLVVVDSVESHACKEIAKGDFEILPAVAAVTKNIHYHVKQKRTIFSKIRRKSAESWQDWSFNAIEIDFNQHGNIALLGGRAGYHKKRKEFSRWFYCNSHLKNIIKIAIGFIPAMLTFILTKDWWLLAWFGAPIWFAITGIRNIIQSVLGGGGLRRSPLLPWNSFVSWSRIADSLLFTGFSVPLLDWLVKNLLLAEQMGVTTATNPLLLYAVMGLANGIYISSHNVLRGLPKQAAIGNFFRSILSIPVAFALNCVVGAMLGSCGVVAVDAILQKWAAVLSKFASDCVAAIIEGLADRKTNIDARLSAYMVKLRQVYEHSARLDLLLPAEDTIALLADPKKTIGALHNNAEADYRSLVVNALDLMYFWYYQPRARKALEILIAEMDEEELLIFANSQNILREQKEISQLFVDGLVGSNFAKALAFYLQNHQGYLQTMYRVFELDIHSKKS